ncbi:MULTISPECIES: ABC transporter ATP-binding protein [unclassified Methylophilus]|uniref:ABC transporter ATP-binding protein n=1 Tax=unclassified Methylophilus TaxID=2630143 RepID=UPI0003656B70|nr:MULTISPECIES: ABC transporter ATP-binding protein [unclassified Methylophilus]
MLTLRDLWQQLRLQSRRLWLGQWLAFLGAVVAVPIPLLMPLLVDEVLLHQPGKLTQLMTWLLPADSLGPIAIILLVTLLTMSLRLGSVLLGVATTRIFVGLSKQVTLGVRQTLLDKLSRIRMQVYESLGAGQITARLLTDIETLDKFLGETIAKVLVAVLSVIGVAVVLLWMHWQLALIILLLNPFVIGLTMVLGKKVKVWKQRENSAFEMLSQSVTETLEVMQQLRASNSDKRFLDKAKQAAEAVRAAATASGWKSDALSRLSFGIFLFGFEIFRAVAMLMVVFSNLSVGQMIAVFGYLWFMMGPVQELLSVQVSYYAAKAALGRINQVLAADEEPHYPAQVNGFATQSPAAIRLQQVTFAYGEGSPILEDVTLDIAPGEQVALVGVSGAGKSTLVQLLLGLYAPSRGQILFNGQAMEQLGYAQIREHLGVVLQQPMLFNDSVRQNLSLDQPYADDALWQALEVAQLAQFVRDLPEGLDTQLGRSGVRLSGGQRQRLAIARMMLKQPQIVILDEATSMLDTHTEALLHQAMRTFLRGRTTIIIAHRLSAVKEADRVLVFDGGRIIEEGQHETLVKQAGSVYQRLYGQQTA